MSRRLIIIISASVILIVPAIVIILLVNRNPKLQNTILKVANINQAVTNTTTTNTNTPANALAKDREAAVFVARSFAERFGSGSNQNNFSNLILAETYGTKSFNDSLNRSIAQQKLTLKTTPFQSTITKAMSISVGSFTTTSGHLTVTAQRQETIDRAVRVYYQDLILEMLKVGADWKVNAASWKVS